MFLRKDLSHFCYLNVLKVTLSSSSSSSSLLLLLLLLLVVVVVVVVVLSCGAYYLHLASYLILKRVNTSVRHMEAHLGTKTTNIFPFDRVIVDEILLQFNLFVP